MTNPRRYLTRVILFLVLVAVLVAVLSPVLWRALLHNVALNSLILAVLVLGIAYNVRRILSLRPEIRWIEDFRSYATGFSQHEPPHLVAPIVNALGERDRRGRTSLSAVSLRHLLDSLSSRLDESRDIARYQTGLLIFLGLLGTFWGLLQSINAVGGVISGLTIGSGDFVSVFNDMKAGLSRPLSGMGTAFSSSLFGLAGSLVLGFLDLQASQAQNSFYNGLEEWLSSFTRHGDSDGMPSHAIGAPALPTYVQGLLQQTAESIERLQGVVLRSEEGKSQLNQSLDGLGRHIALLGDRLHEQHGQLARLADAQRDLSERIVRFQSASGGLDEASRQHLRSVDYHLTRLLENDAKGREQLVRELRGEIRLVSRTIAAAAGDPQLLRE